MPTLICLSTR